MHSFECFNCHKVLPLATDKSDKCPSCGSSNGQIVDEQRVKDSMDAGAYFNIDPKTGKPAKKKK